jgi:hypothetical protein
MFRHDVLLNGPSEQRIGRQQRHDCGRDIEQAAHRGNKVQYAMPMGPFELLQQMLLRACHDLVPRTPTRGVRRRVPSCGLPQPVLSLAQRLEGLLVGATFSNGPLPPAIPHHGLNLAIHTVAIYLTALFRQGHAREEKKEQGQ